MKKSKLNWDNLRNMKCPQCDADIFKVEHIYECEKCVFSISLEKFDELMKKIYDRSPREKIRIPTEEENLSALNNLDEEESSEGFLEDDIDIEI
jgi:hypothetical protein